MVDLGPTCLVFVNAHEAALPFHKHIDKHSSWWLPFMFHVCSSFGAGRIKLDSNSEFARQGWAVRVTCGGCGNVSVRNAIELIGELHRRGVSLGVEQAERRMKCKACGVREAKIQPALI